MYKRPCYPSVCAQVPQCNNSKWPTLSCCLPKTACTDFVGKAGDTAWSAGQPGVAGDVCTLLSLSPAVEQFLADGERGAGVGLRTGINGLWAPLKDGSGLTFSRNNSYDNSSGAAWQDPASAAADFTLLSADAAIEQAGVYASASATSDLGALWADFAADGSLALQQPVAMYGAVAASTQLLPGATRTLTLVFAWRLPFRLYVGQELGNEYAKHYESSEAAARDVATRLPEIVADGAEWNSACTNNSLPAWMQVRLARRACERPHRTLLYRWLCG